MSDCAVYEFVKYSSNKQIAESLFARICISQQEAQCRCDSGHLSMCVCVCVVVTVDVKRPAMSDFTLTRSVFSYSRPNYSTL